MPGGQAANAGHRTSHIVLFAALSALGSVAPLDAQPRVTPLWASDSIHSEILQETRQLRISLPIGYDEPDNANESYPLLIVLDAGGDLVFSAAISNARALASRGSPSVPQLIIVGVLTPNPSRYHNMTPTSAATSEYAAEGAGGAPDFLRFLSTELQPMIAARYRALPVTVLAGHSLTGMFTTWAFGAAPDFLMGAIATSPSVHLAEGEILGLLSDRTQQGRFFLMSGTAERGLNEVTRTFAGQIRDRAQGRWAFQYQDIDETAHINTALMGMIPALRFVFRPVSLDGLMLDYDLAISTLVAQYDSARASYLHGAQELGLPPRLPMSFLLSQVRFHQSSEGAPILARVCKDFMEMYPAKWNGYECAGDAALRLEQPTQAAAFYRQASDVARRAEDTETANRLSRKAESMGRR